MKTRLLAALACALAGLLAAPEARAIRPFVTDDARVVGDKLAQLETWLLVDRHVTEHDVLAAIGPTDWLELTAGFTHGVVRSGRERGYSVTGPIFQGKALLFPGQDGGLPGVAVAAGVLPPLGHGAFTPPGFSGFSYLALTESLFDEDLLLHANVGLALAEGAWRSPGGASAPPVHALVTAGLGFQARVVAGLHGLAEIYHGDPYDVRTDFPAMQAGFRYVFTDEVQVDGTFGSTLTNVKDAGGHAQTEQWVTVGLRLVTPELW